MTTYKKHFKVILAILSILILIMIISVIHIFFFTPLYTPLNYSDYDIYIRKDIYAKSLSGKKIIIAAGSSANYGVNSEVLSSKTDYEVLNLGLSAGNPLNYLKYKIMKYVKKGDIVVLPLEFAYYERNDNFNRTISEYYTTCYTDFFYKLSFYERIEVLKKILPSYPLRLVYGLKSLPIATIDKVKTTVPVQILRDIGDNLYSIANANKYGEYFVALPATGFAITAFENGASFGFDGKTSDLFISEIKSLEKELKEIGVNLYITFPSTIRNKKFDVTTEETQKLLKKLLSNIEANDIKFFGNPYFYNLPLEYFFDNRYHLNARGCILRTLCLADDINKMLKEGAKVDFTPPSEEYIAEKLEETELILEDFHKRQDELDALNKN